MWCRVGSVRSPELDLALGGEVDLVEGRVEVLRERLEEVGVLIVRHVRGRAHLWGMWVYRSGFRVQGSGFRVQGSGFRVQGFVRGRAHLPSANFVCCQHFSS